MYAYPLSETGFYQKSTRGFPLPELEFPNRRLVMKLACRTHDQVAVALIRALGGVFVEHGVYELEGGGPDTVLVVSFAGKAIPAQAKAFAGENFRYRIVARELVFAHVDSHLPFARLVLVINEDKIDQLCANAPNIRGQLRALDNPHRTKGKKER